MKTKNSMFITLACLLIFSSCSDSVRFFPEDKDNTANLDFYTRFTSSGTSVEADQSGLKSGTWIYTQQNGSGTATYLGNFTFTMNCLFCCSGSECGKFENGCGCFISRDTGDKLYISFTGKAKMLESNDESGYAGILEDPFQVTGGTGLFKNATGQGVLKSCFTCQLARIDHQMSVSIHPDTE